MRNGVFNVALLAGSMMLLAYPPARGQGPELGLAPKENGSVIHSDIITADQGPEPPSETQSFWVRADAWLGWIKDGSFPPLVTVGATTQPRPGAIGQDGTMVRFGGHVDTQERFGANFRLGAWLDPEECVGAEVGFCFLASRDVFFELSSPGAPAIARPFFDVIAQRQDASLVTFPGLASGGINVRSGTALYGADATMLLALNRSHDYPVRLLFGIRYLQLHDDLDINENSHIDPSSPVFAGQQISVRDLFDCNNYFYGGFLGMSGAYSVRRLEVQATAKCALGLTQEIVGVAGWTHFEGPGVDKTVPAGLLALSSNSGSRLRESFGVVPEADLDARFELTKHIFLTAGYSFLYWNHIARSGRQVDLNVNPDLIPTSSNFGQPSVTQQPQLSVKESDFWLHAVRLGVELRF